MPPRGQILFVRPITYGDTHDLRRLTGTADIAVPSNGLIGRLVGETVSFLAFTPAREEIRIDDIFVAPDLRRKRVGRVLIGELEEVARQLHCDVLTVNPECHATEFFVKLGFVETNSLLRKSIQ